MLRRDPSPSSKNIDRAADIDVYAPKLPFGKDHAFLRTLTGRIGFIEDMYPTVGDHLPRFVDGLDSEKRFDSAVGRFIDPILPLDLLRKRDGMNAVDTDCGYDHGAPLFLNQFVL